MNNKLDQQNQLIDPVSHTSNRTEFALNSSDAIYMSNMKLLNIGVTTTANHSRYNIFAGVAGLIKNIYLYDGRRVLSSLKDANRWAAWSNFNRVNSKNLSYEGFLDKNKLGFRLEADGTDFQVKYVNTHGLTTADENTTSKGCVYLADMFPLLRKLPYLHAGVFKNLRVVVEYEADARKVLQLNNPTNMTPIRPVLSVDVVQDDELQQMLTADALNMQVQFTSYEHDLFIVAAQNATAATQPLLQTTNAILNNFNSKYVSRLLVCKEYTDPSKYLNGANVTGPGALGSLQQYREEHQVRINGADVLPEGGVKSNEGAQAAYVVDTWGETNNYLAAHMHNESDIANDLNDGRNLAGRAGFMACRVDDVINNFQYKFGRHNLDDNAPIKVSNEQLTVHVYGEVVENLIVENGEYEIVRKSN